MRTDNFKLVAFHTFIVFFNLKVGIMTIAQNIIKVFFKQKVTIWVIYISPDILSKRQGKLKKNERK